jgi:hypothetical protein
MRRAAIAILTTFASAAALAAPACAQTQDRYGPQAPASQTVATADTPTLIWPGKAAPEDSVPPPPAPPAPQPAPPPVAAAPVPPAMVAAGLRPHRYSVVRQFGLRPDPIPLPSQFFADNAAADLAAPPPPLDPHPVPGTQAVTSTASANTPANRARAIALDTASPDDTGN